MRVLQGSILGPLLFSISFNDVADVTKNCKITLYTSGSSAGEIEVALNRDFKRVVDKMRENELIVDISC